MVEKCRDCGRCQSDDPEEHRHCQFDEEDSYGPWRENYDN